MITAIVLFWLFFILSLHPWVLYPLMLMGWSRLVRNQPTWEELDDDDKPLITVVIPAYNEERLIARRIANILSLNWPSDRLEVVVSSDGSDDATEEIVRKFAEEDPRIRLLALSRGGQAAAIDHGVKAARGELVVITDAATSFDENVLRKLSIPFADPQVQCVVGEISMLPLEESALCRAEGFYWRFEATLRRLEAVLGMGFHGSGPCTMARREGFPVIDPRAAADLDLTLKMVQAGGRVIHLRNIGVYDYMDGNIAGQMRSRPRRTVQGLTCFVTNRRLLNPFLYPGHSFAILSHKIMRWLTGIWVIGLFFVSGLLAFGDTHPFYTAFFSLQVAFYVLALIGFIFARTPISRFPLLAVPLSTVVVMLAFLKGVFEFLFGKRDGTWQPAGSGDNVINDVTE